MALTSRGHPRPPRRAEPQSTTLEAIATCNPDAPCDALCQKTVTLPLRMFGTERGARSIPTQLYCYVRLEDEVHDLGMLQLRYEEAPGRNARLIVVNSSLITRTYSKHRITGWTILGDEVAVMFLLPPTEEGDPPPGQRVRGVRPNHPSFGPSGLALGAIDGPHEDELALAATALMAVGRTAPGGQRRNGYGSGDGSGSTEDGEDTWGAPGGGGWTAGGEGRIALTPIEDEDMAARLLDMPVDVPSNAVMSNNNVSIPLLLFGPSHESRVLPAKVQLYANIDGRYAVEMGWYHVRVSAQVSQQRAPNNTRMKLTVGSSGTLYKKFPEPAHITGWSRVSEASLLIYVSLQPGALLPADLQDVVARCAQPACIQEAGKRRGGSMPAPNVGATPAAGAPAAKRSYDSAYSDEQPSSGRAQQVLPQRQSSDPSSTKRLRLEHLHLDSPSNTAQGAAPAGGSDDAGRMLQRARELMHQHVGALPAQHQPQQDQLLCGPNGMPISLPFRVLGSSGADAVSGAGAHHAPWPMEQHRRQHPQPQLQQTQQQQRPRTPPSPQEQQQQASLSTLTANGVQLNTAMVLQHMLVQHQQRQAQQQQVQVVQQQVQRMPDVHMLASLLPGSAGAGASSHMQLQLQSHTAQHHQLVQLQHTHQQAQQQPGFVRSLSDRVQPQQQQLWQATNPTSASRQSAEDAGDDRPMPRVQGGSHSPVLNANPPSPATDTASDSNAHGAAQNQLAGAATTTHSSSSGPAPQPPTASAPAGADLARPLPLLPDLDDVVGSGMAGMAKYFLQVMSCLRTPSDLKMAFMAFAKSDAALEHMRVLYVFMQDACSARDARAAAKVVDELGELMACKA